MLWKEIKSWSIKGTKLKSKDLINSYINEGQEIWGNWKQNIKDFNKYFAQWIKRSKENSSFNNLTS